jgi:hypothetical protein
MGGGSGIYYGAAGIVLVDLSTDFMIWIKSLAIFR